VIGETISHYRVLAKLGAGGMGDVYLAEDTALKRKVALKFLQADINVLGHAKQRFLREARAAATLHHPNIVHVYEVGEADGKPFIAMEYIDGETLDRHIDRGPLDVREILRIGTEIADALAEAHQAGITHRDIKSSNVMITPRGHVKVLDFGLAKVVAEAADHSGVDSSTEVRTAAGVVVGTVHYMAPEQALGRDVDERADLFSVGAVLYELATGRRPFAGASPTETLDRVLHAQPEAVTRFNRDAPADLERIIRKCLEKEPERRYQSARELIADLRNLQRDLGRVARVGETRISIGRTWRLWAALGTALVIASAAALYWRHSRNQSIDSVAVLPFTNAAADGGNEYLSDGITENLIDRLSRVSALRVVPRSTVFRYKDREVNPSAIGRELSVRAIILGRVAQRGQALTVRAELVDVNNDAQLWGAQYDRSVTDLQALQDELASAVAERLRPDVTIGEHRDLTRRFTESPEAHLLYLKGRYFWNKRSPQEIRKGLDYFRQAIDLDPAYSLAYAGLADCYNFLGAIGISALPPHEAMAKARAAALKALEIDDSLAEAHASLGFVKFYYDWDWPGAEREFQRAIALNPKYPPGHQWYAHLLMARGRTSEAIAAAKRAVELDPLSLAANMSAGWLYEWARQPQLSIQQLRKTLELDPTFTQARWFLGVAYEQSGMYDEAVAELEKTVAASPDDAVYLASLGRAYATAGRRSDAINIRRQLEERSKRSFVPAYWMASLYVALGDSEAAFRWLEKAYAERSGGLVWIGVDPRMDPIRPDPRFAALRQRIESD
jgi:serine/threonine-protein kinase